MYIPRLYCLKSLFPNDNIMMCILELKWNKSVCELSSKCFWCSSLTPRDNLCVKTSLLFDETMNFSFQNSTIMLHHSFETLSFLRPQHTIAKLRLGFIVSSCSLIEILLVNVVLLIILKVSLNLQCPTFYWMSSYL
jgi:hypothetical protein